MVQMGSVWWRINNYGLTRTLRFIYFDYFLRKLGLLSAKYETKNDEDQLHELAQALGLPHHNVLQIRNFSHIFLIAAAAEANSRGINLKKDVAGLNGPLMRLTVIGSVVYRFRPDIYIETGTQHGISAEFVRRLTLEYKLETEVISIDVNHDQRDIINSGYIHKILMAPVARNVLKLFDELALEKKRFVFHHDSDHSYEHMSWELKMATERLDPVAVVCDDIEQHRAFPEFASDFFGVAYSFGGAGQSICGLTLKGDPDGT